MKHDNKKLIEDVKNHLKIKKNKKEIVSNKSPDDLKEKLSNSQIKVAEKIIEKEIKAWINCNALNISKELISKEIDKKFKK